MPNQTWSDRFKISLNDDPEEKNYKLNIIVNTDSENDDKDIFIAGWNALAHDYVHKSLVHLEKLVEIVDSPIEEAMLYALCTTAHEQVSNVRYKVNNFVFGDFPDEPDLLIIEPQAKLGEYRADFLLTYKESVPDYQNLVKLKNGTQVANIKEATSNLIIECDGHDYHDRTKQQASNDRKRDRELKKLGFEVFRYTGSDIWENPMSCAQEAIEVLVKSALNK